MITTNEAWDLKNAALGKKPIYVLAIGGEAKPGMVMQRFYDRGMKPLRNGFGGR